MASVATISTRPPANPPLEIRELSESMDKVREELEKVRSKPDVDNVHDLRVAIRRCRSVAAVFEEIDPDEAWPEMRRKAKRLFRALGELRDGHVMADWVKKLAPENDEVRKHLHKVLEADEPELVKEVEKAAGKFDEKAWKRLRQRLRRRVRYIPVGGLAAECLARERFEEIKQRHLAALRTEKAKPWHALRIVLKKFRYTVETLLPEHHAAWSNDLKRLQDLLGEIHDLDVLAGRVKAETESDEALRTSWKEKIQRERDARVQTYRQLTLGKTSIWNKWSHGLPHGERLEAASFARLQATARATQSKPRKVARISLRIFELLRRSKAASVFGEPNMRRNLRASALLHGIGNDEKHPTRAARKFLLAMEAPPRWTRDQWELVAWAVRFHRGAEPAEDDGQFAILPAAAREHVRALAGVVRLGRAVHKSGIDSPVGFKIEVTAEIVTLFIPNLVDSLENAERLAAGKHLLETLLGVPVVVRAAATAARTVAVEEARREVLFAVAGGGSD
jgi:CHAD domain-containing protein